jgi:hypothetical protein
MTTPTLITFFGSDQYSAVVMQGLIASPKVDVTSLITIESVSAHPLHQLASTHNIPITLYSPDLTLTHPTGVAVLASFGHILPPDIISLFPGGILCLHPSLLPQYRNTSPVPYAIALGDKMTGVTLFRIDNSIDNGKILAQSEEPILDSDTSPVLLKRLFTLGTNLVISHLTSPTEFTESTASTEPLIFTHRLTTESGHLEWEVVQKLINNHPIITSDTKNKLLQLRLTRQGSELSGSSEPRIILTDLIRALDGWEKVWTIADTKKGDLRISLVTKDSNILVHLAGKPNPISYSNFHKYYLSNK